MGWYWREGCCGGLSHVSARGAAVVAGANICERLARPPFWRRRFLSHARGLVGWCINIYSFKRAPSGKLFEVELLHREWGWERVLLLYSTLGDDCVKSKISCGG